MEKDTSAKEILSYLNIPDFLTELMRNFYFGGRVEVFNFNFCIDGAYNDFNSFYPAQMFNYLFPIPPYRLAKPSESDKFALYRAIHNPNIFGVIAEVTENMNIPLIPYRLENGKIMFPNGKKLCFLFKEELIYLKELKQDIQIKQYCFCSGFRAIFKEFIEKTYFPRQQNKKLDGCLKCWKVWDKEKYKDVEFCPFCNAPKDEIYNLGNNYESYLYKIFMNALYGKFAEKETKEVIVYFNKIEDAIQFLVDKKLLPEKHSLQVKNEIVSKYITHEILGNLKIYKYTGTETLKINNNIFFSMYITALARLELHKMLTKKNSDPFYCDTDSLVTGRVIDNSDELGGLKPEFTFEKFQGFGCKEYAIDKMKESEAKMKGFTIDSKITIKEYAQQYLLAHKQFRPAKFKEIMKRGLANNEVVVFDKYKSSFYDKRWINEDFTTKPFNIDTDNFEELQDNNRKMIFKRIAFILKKPVKEIYKMFDERFDKN